MASGSFVANGSASVDVSGYNQSKALNTVYLIGTWGGGTVVVECSPDGGTTWVAIPDKYYTSNAVVNLEGRWTNLRLTLSGATSPTLGWWVL